jgi:crotonobetainyl-CoA:carnitine CoA-transferase CaiB-like acyl-CoA transferase
MASAFEGVRVVDLSHGLVGAMAAMLLGDFGAQVLRIEGEGAADPAADAGWNRNKRILSLDLGRPDDRRRIDQYLDGADVVVFDQGPAQRRRLRLEEADLLDGRPSLVALWTPPYGETGAWSDLPAHHGMLMGLSGASFRQGAWGDDPVWHVTPIAHYAQAVLGAAAAGAALLARRRGGEGRAVTVSGLHALSQVACPLTELGGLPMGRGSPIGSSPSYRLYQCGDGEWLFLGTLFSHFFSRAADALGLEGRDLYDPAAAIETRLASAPRAHWLSLFRAHDAPAAPVARREDWLDHEVCRDNDLAASIDHPRVGAVRTPGLAARLEATPGRRPAPATPTDEAWLGAFLQPRPAPRADASPPLGPPLAGVKVLDLGTVIAGTYAATILANFGADVVKIEPADGDPFRFAVTGFINYNRGKRGLGLDLKAPTGRELFLDLCREADVVLDNYRLGVRERLGIDHAQVRAVNERLISCSANTYGSRGAHARMPGFDPLIQAMSGLMAAQGADSEPVFHTIPVNDVATAAVTAFAVIAALNARETSGEGQTVETSLAASSTLYQFAELIDFAGRPAPPVGGRDCPGFTALNRFHACADGWITLAASEPAHVEALAKGLGPGAGLDGVDPQAALAAPRDGELARAVGGALAGRSREDVLAALAQAGAPAAPVLSAREASQSEFLWDNGYFQIFGDPRWGELVGSRGFARFGDQPAAFERLAPDLGEHSGEVLLDYGVERDRIIALARAGVIFRG